MTGKRICVIGAGAAGLPSIKACLECDLDVVCYEKTDFVGGLYRYREEHDETLASVMKSMTLNTSKELNAYSDYLMPEHFPNFLNNRQMVSDILLIPGYLLLKHKKQEYFECYAKEFNLEQYIAFEHEVQLVKPNYDFDQTGRWVVTVRDMVKNRVFDEVFDGVMVSTGHHVKPVLPSFPGQNMFKGEIIHMQAYKKPDAYKDKSVAVVGIGISGGDVSVELTSVCKKVYLSTRRGAWVYPRMGLRGLPFDAQFLRRSWIRMFRMTPLCITNYLFEAILNANFDHKRYGLKPKHHAFSQQAILNELLPYHIACGNITIKRNISRFTENGVVFDGDEKETKLDAVIFATGYLIDYPFMDESVFKVNEKNEAELFKNMFIPNIAHPHTLAFIGLVQPYGATFPVCEMQARWHAQLLAGKCRPLPSAKKMMKDIKAYKRYCDKRYYSTPRNTLQLDYIPYMDYIASRFGAKPNVTKYFFTDPKLWYEMVFNPIVAYQWRLTGPGKWKGAREAILTYDRRVNRGYNPNANK